MSATAYTIPPEVGRSRRPAAAVASEPLRIQNPRRRRRPILVAASTALMVTCAAIFANAYAGERHHTSVLTIIRSIGQGEVIDATDLATTSLPPAPGVVTVPASALGQVVGRRASVALLPSTLLSPADISSSPTVPNGQAIVGVGLKPGLLPADGVASGERVDVVLVGSAGSSVATGGTALPGVGGADAGAPEGTGFGTVMVPAATVVGDAAAATSSGSATISVSVLVPESAAPAVAAASAAGQVALVVVNGPT